MNRRIITGWKTALALFCLVLVLMGWKDVHAGKPTVRYSGDGVYELEQWNFLISEYANKRHLSVFVDGNAARGDFYVNREVELMVPARKLTEYFNCAENLYDDRELVIQKRDVVLRFYRDQPDVYYVNDVEQQVAGALEQVEGELFLRASIVAEHLGFEYFWDVATNIADFVTTWQETILPARYSLRDVGRSTVVRNQGSHGTCWAVASLTALETTLRPEEQLLFSAENMALKNSFTRALEQGGEYTMSMAYLLAWQGPVLEEEDVYGDLWSPDGLEPAKHVQEVQIIKNKNLEKIKEAVFKNGAVQTSIYTSLQNSTSRSKYYNRETCAYYYSGDSPSNHEIIIIGWDDNFSRDNFNIKPQQDGAFLCQNSWGTRFGDEGVFYVSYEDARIGEQSVTYSGVEDVTNYDNLYQTDLCGWVGQIGYGRETCHFANVFTAQGRERVRAVGFYATGENTSYEVYKVTDYRDEESLSQGELAAVGTVENPGFYTVPLTMPFVVEEGSRFAIVVRIYTPGAVHPVAVEYAVEEKCSQVVLEDGEGYISPYGADWVRVENDYGCNVCMKVYTNDEK